MATTDSHSAATGTRAPGRPIAAGAFLLFGAIATYLLVHSGTLSELYTYWVEGYNWQFLIPVAFLFMLNERRDLLRSIRYRPAPWTGGVLLAGALAMLIAGELSSTHKLRELALIGGLFGMTALLFGIDALRKLFWPLAYLVLMTSIPNLLLEELRTPLKVISATMATDALQALGYAVYREWTYLYLPHITLEVADSCSGLNQLTSAIALGIPIAFILMNRLWKRVFIIALTAAAAIVMNWVRVFLIAIWHYDSAKESIHGPHGIYELPFIFLVGVGGVLAIAMAMADKPLNARREAGAEAPSGLSALLRRRDFLSAATLAVLLNGAALAYLATWQSREIPAPQGLDALLSEIGGTPGQRVEQLPRPFRQGVTDAEFAYRYRLEDGGEALLYLGWFPRQDQQQELVDFRYDWALRDSRVRTIPLADGSDVPVRERELGRRDGDARRVAALFYRINGRFLVDPARAKLASLIDALRERRTDGAIVVVLFDASVPEVRRTRFLQELAGRLAVTLP